MDLGQNLIAPFQNKPPYQEVEPKMETFDLTSLSLDELKSLQTKVAKAIDTYEDRRRKEAAAELEAQAKALGFTLAELSDFSRKSKPALPPKYRHPENPSLTWSGRGRKPGWIKDAERFRQVTG